MLNNSFASSVSAGMIKVPIGNVIDLCARRNDDGTLMEEIDAI